MALAGNGRWCYLDPKLGAMHAVAEAARKVACTGATPVAATNCLNFGNPEKPEIMAQLSHAIDGIAEACTALGTPITGGNVSLYNETRGEGIYPTPVIGIVGILDDVTQGRAEQLPRRRRQGSAAAVDRRDRRRSVPRELGSSDFAKSVLGAFWGAPPWLNLHSEAALHKAAREARRRAASSTPPRTSPTAAWPSRSHRAASPTASASTSISVRSGDAHMSAALFSENATEVLITCAPRSLRRGLLPARRGRQLLALDIGDTIADRIEIFAEDDALIDAPLAELQHVYSAALEAQLAEEVLA